jgi:uncharacterized protein YutE (UPF0331/DUF86 family)
MKGFRNILVHEYGGIDDRIVYEAIQSRLDDFEAFKREILRALQGLSHLFLPRGMMASKSM